MSPQQPKGANPQLGSASGVFSRPSKPASGGGVGVPTTATMIVDPTTSSSYLAGVAAARAAALNQQQPVALYTTQVGRTGLI